MNVRLIVILVTLAAVIASALGVVYTRHEARRYSVELSQLENKRDDIIAEWSRLQLEQAFLADGGQVESKARQQLNMESPEQSVILVIEP